MAEQETRHKNKRKPFWLIPLGLGLVILAAICINIVMRNEFTITIDCEDGRTYEIEYGETFKYPSVTASYQGSILHFWDTELETTITDDIDYTKLGTYTVEITASHKDLLAKKYAYVTIKDTTAPTITLVHEDDYYTNPNDDYVEEGFSAKDNYDGDITEKVMSFESDGEVTYTVSDSSGNETSVVRTIAYRDEVAPILSLAGEASMTVNYATTFSDPGYMAFDDCDGEITDRVEVAGEVDTSVLGDYTLTYTVQDSYGNEATASRLVSVRDTSAPSLSLNGKSKLYLKLGTDYSEEGATATDNMDGNLTGRISVSSNVNTARKGVYKVTYSVADSSGNSASLTRKVYVYEKQAEDVSVDPGDKVVYLTFDDGPSPYTEKLLDTLDKYGVKATFFVTGQSQEYKSYVKEEAKRGHSIALHTYSHSYASVYASEEAYFADLEKIGDYVEGKIGYRPTIIRFPGGSSNQVSANYCKGLMTELVDEVGLMGYRYCDWNVSSGDGSGSISKEDCVNNVISGIKKLDVSVVLQHDTVKNSVDAVEEILAWGIAHGYTFLPMDDSTPMVHHTTLNN